MSREIAEKLADALPLHDARSPLAQLRAYLRHFLHPQASMRDAAEVLMTHLSAGSEAAAVNFPSAIWENAVEWSKKQVALPTVQPANADEGIPAIPPDLLPKNIQRIALPFLQGSPLLEALEEQFPQASFACFSPTLPRRPSQAFWLQPLLLGYGASPSQGQSAIFGGEEAWEKGWDVLSEPYDLMAANLFFLPTERFERGRARLIEGIDEHIAKDVHSLSCWKEPLYRNYTVRMLYWLLGRMQRRGHLLLLLPQWLIKEEAWDGVREYIDRHAVQVFLRETVYKETPAFWCSIALGQNALPPKRQMMGTALTANWEGWHPLPSSYIKLGEKLERKTALSHPARFFAKCFEIKPWQEEGPKVFAHWQHAPLGIATPWVNMPDVAWPYLFFGKDLKQPNKVLLLSEKPFAVWAFDSPFVPNALEGEKLWAFPLYIYEGGKCKENVHVPSFKLIKQWAQAQYPLHEGASSAALKEALEEAAKLSRLMPVLQKYVGKLQELLGNRPFLHFDGFAAFLEEIARFKSKIAQLLAGAHERKATFERLLLCLQQMENMLTQSKHAHQQALAQQALGTPEGFFFYMYSMLQKSGFSEEWKDWLPYRLPVIGLVQHAWEEMERGKALMMPADAPVTHDFSWEALQQMPFAKWQEFVEDAVYYLGHKPAIRLAWEALRKLGKQDYKEIPPDRLWANALAQYGRLL